MKDRLPLRSTRDTELGIRLFELAAAGLDSTEFLKQAMVAVRDGLSIDFAAFVRGEKGQWRTVAATDANRNLPQSLLERALDEGETVVEGEWYVGPQDGRAPGESSGSRGELVVAFQSDGIVNRSGFGPSLRRFLGEALRMTREREGQRRQISRLTTLLEIAAQWRQTTEMNDLLARMAEVSTKLLQAERASIFLWDRATRTLVGRPALGVEGGELRIPEDAGVAGQVVQSGETRRVDADVPIDQREIDRRVDQKLKFQTRSLLCVPLRGKQGELFGAFEVINKIGGNFTADDEQALRELATHAAVALENTQQWEQLLSAQRQIADQAEQGVQLIGQCPAIHALRSTINRVADTDLAVLVLGENGTGKEVVAQMIHYRSRRRQEPLVAVNCAALPDTLLESELFGHEKGAFTDAREMRRGKFELAASGTLFLDEIGDMSLAGQAKLLRVLEEKVVVRVGGSQPIPTATRVIAATNQNLAELVGKRKFREDLYFRLNVVTLDLPPLRARGEDVLLLAEHFLAHFAARARRKTPRFTAAAKKRLLAHSWPGNIRELRNLMERLAYLAPEDQDKLDAPDLAFSLSPGDAAVGALSLDLPLGEATERFQSEYIQRKIEQLRGNMTAVAENLGLHRSNLYRKMRQLGMETTNR